MEAVHVVRSGLYATVQDLGRSASRIYGVPSGGAMDRVSLRAANLLVGNPEDAACLELTLTGPTLEFTGEAVIALCGADFAASVNGLGLEPGRPVYVPRGAVLTAGAARTGARGYLALSGGIAVPPALASRSTYARARLGGLDGRPLAAGDRLAAGPLSEAADRLLQRLRGLAAGADAPAAAPWRAAPALFPGCAAPDADGAVSIRAIRGSEAGRFRPEDAAAFFSAAYTLRPESDRMGCRLAGEAVRLAEPYSMLSEPVAPGTVQIPPDGQPIVLLADCQTVGGYPRIAHVAAADLPRLAQILPASRVRFKEISLVEAHTLLLEQEAGLARLRTGLADAGNK